MWTPGNGAPPNVAGVFNLVHPLPCKEFTSYGVRHRMCVVGLRVPAAAAAAGVQGRETWWNKDSKPSHGFGAALVPVGDAKHVIELLGEVAVVE